MYGRSAHPAPHKFRTPICLVWKVLRVTSLATPQLLANCYGVVRWLRVYAKPRISPFPVTHALHCADISPHSSSSRKVGDIQTQQAQPHFHGQIHNWVKHNTCHLSQKLIW
jgi:hypothetical protein